MKKLLILLISSLVISCATTGPTQKDLEHLAEVERLQPENNIKVWTALITDILSEQLSEPVKVRLYDISFLYDNSIVIMRYTVIGSCTVMKGYLMFDIEPAGGWKLLDVFTEEITRMSCESRGTGHEEL